MRNEKTSRIYLFLCKIIIFKYPSLVTFKYPSWLPDSFDGNYVLTFGCKKAIAVKLLWNTVFCMLFYTLVSWLLYQYSMQTIRDKNAQTIVFITVCLPYLRCVNKSSIVWHFCVVYRCLTVLSFLCDNVNECSPQFWRFCNLI